jgi:hypothetical protein
MRLLASSMRRKRAEPFSLRWVPWSAVVVQHYRPWRHRPMAPVQPRCRDRIRHRCLSLRDTVRALRCCGTVYALCRRIPDFMNHCIRGYDCRPTCGEGHSILLIEMLGIIGANTTRYLTWNCPIAYVGMHPGSIWTRRATIQNSLRTLRSCL